MKKLLLMIAAAALLCAVPAAARADSVAYQATVKFVKIMVTDVENKGTEEHPILKFVNHPLTLKWTADDGKNLYLSFRPQKSGALDFQGILRFQDHQFSAEISGTILTPNDKNVVGAGSISGYFQLGEGPQQTYLGNSFSLKAAASGATKDNPPTRIVGTLKFCPVAMTDPADSEGRMIVNLTMPVVTLKPGSP